MGLQEWTQKAVENITQEDPRLPRFIGPFYDFYVGALHFLMSHSTLGTNVFQRDWDLLIILDACRVDAIREVKGEYEFIDTVDSITSVGSTSAEWLFFTFARAYTEQIQETAMVTGNPHTQGILENNETPLKDSKLLATATKGHHTVDIDDFAHFDALWKYQFDKAFNEVNAHFTTEKAISVGRSVQAEKYIVHYMYPHEPFISDERNLDIFDIAEGTASEAEILELYLEKLRHVLDEVEHLLQNVHAEDMVITSDHGEAFGELGFYKHQIGCPIPSVRRIPSIMSSGTDSHEYMAEPDNRISGKDVSAKDRWKDLGYLE